jgi:glycerol-3-phosphate dehydrogenase
MEAAWHDFAGSGFAMRYRHIDVTIDDMHREAATHSALDSRILDILVIGAGVVGSSVARVLSHLDCSVAVVEKAYDVGAGASARNSGVIHAGLNYKPGTKRARFCMEGRELLQAWCSELNVPVSICGKLIVARSEDEIPSLEQLKSQGEVNGVPGLRIVSADEAAALQPGIVCVAALHVPSSGIVSPYALTIAMAEDAAINGVRFFLGSEVTGIEPEGETFAVRTSTGLIRARWIINCAGVHAGRVAQMIDAEAPELHPCVGEYLILDKQVGERMTMSVYPAPQVGGAGLGVHITPTTEGNVLLGPSSEYVDDPETVGCTGCTTDRLLEEARAMWPEIPADLVIGAYAGVRAKLPPPEVGGYGDYVFRRTPEHPHAIHLIGIESPGLTAAPAIARHIVEEMIQPDAGFASKPASAIRLRRWPTRFDELSEEDKERLVREDPDSGDIVCRCEGVTKAEILHALGNPLGVRTLSGIKFRSRAMMGRCSGGYCLPRIVEILQQEAGWSPEAFELRGPASPAFAGRLLEIDDG